MHLDASNDVIFAPKFDTRTFFVKFCPWDVASEYPARNVFHCKIISVAVAAQKKDRSDAQKIC